MSNSDIIVLVTTRYFDPVAEVYLAELGCRVVRSGLPLDQHDDALPAAEIERLAAGAAGWIVGIAPVTRALMTALPDLRVIARRGVGYDRVDVAAARELGRVVTIAAGGNELSVAEHAMALMLGLAKRLTTYRDRAAEGVWRAQVGRDLAGCTVGLIGLGRIGQRLVRRLAGFDVRLIAHDPAPDGGFAAAHDVEMVSLPTLLADSDFISLHVPLNAATRHLIGRAELAVMKPSALLINTARGGLIDEPALLAALQTGQIAGAGLDVSEAEDDASLVSVRQALARLPNVVMTPHVGGNSEEALARANLIAARCVLSVLRGSAMPPGCVVADGRPPGKA